MTENRIPPQARDFERSRNAHRNETAEDYVSLIADLIDAHGEARTVDLALRLGVTQPTVNKVLGRLRREGLVEGRPYRAVFLTAEGRDLATRTRERHVVVLEFLLSIGVTEETARSDAEGMEHHISEETLEALRRATRRESI